MVDPFCPPLKVTITFLIGSLFYFFAAPAESLSWTYNTGCSTLQATAKKKEAVEIMNLFFGLL